MACKREPTPTLALPREIRDQIYQNLGQTSRRALSCLVRCSKTTYYEAISLLYTTVPFTAKNTPSILYGLPIKTYTASSMVDKDGALLRLPRTYQKLGATTHFPPIDAEERKMFLLSHTTTVLLQDEKALFGFLAILSRYHNLRSKKNGQGFYRDLDAGTAFAFIKRPPSISEANLTFLNVMGPELPVLQDYLGGHIRIIFVEEDWAMYPRGTSYVHDRNPRLPRRIIPSRRFGSAEADARQRIREHRTDCIIRFLQDLLQGNSSARSRSSDARMPMIKIQWQTSLSQTEKTDLFEKVSQDPNVRDIVRKKVSFHIRNIVGPELPLNIRDLTCPINIIFTPEQAIMDPWHHYAVETGYAGDNPSVALVDIIR
uniref:Uncharacterized protein n=1 Tax=Kwoniella dejecticola CBS 10117 TaxID=1296121 RepID=A0A1A6ABC0_9TREE|nr:uncharacterized protein I303_01550 [Kwoniella dejecticola CBS 10117]OBR87348.1 hypothetical protein I303_01550 [Kwoniella dejecticola CBS 10117]